MRGALKHAIGVRLGWAAQPSTYVPLWRASSASGIEKRAAHIVCCHIIDMPTQISMVSGMNRAASHRVHLAQADATCLCPPSVQDSLALKQRLMHALGHWNNRRCGDGDGRVKEVVER